MDVEHNVITRELYGKRWGLLSMLVPFMRWLLDIKVYSVFDWKVQVIFGTIVLVVWIGFATRKSSDRGNAIVSALLILWAVTLTGWTKF